MVAAHGDGLRLHRASASYRTMCQWPGRAHICLELLVVLVELTRTSRATGMPGDKFLPRFWLT